MANVREPISSSCIATPFNADGQACQGSAVGTPFELFTDGTNPLRLFASAYAPDAPVTGTASGVSTSAATLNATDNPEGASVSASFQFGDDDCVRRLDRGAEARSQRRGDSVQRSADWTRGGDHDPLPGGCDERLRDVRGCRRDARHGVDSAPASGGFAATPRSVT